MAELVADGLELCACCVSKLANDDESGCLDYYNHDQHAMSRADRIPGYWVPTDPIEDDYRTHTCDGCGWPSAIVHGAAVLT